MKCLTVLLLALAACGTETAQSPQFEGVPVDANRVSQVVSYLNAQGLGHIDESTLTFDIVPAAFACDNLGKPGSCLGQTTLHLVKIAMLSGFQPYAPTSDVAATALCHELYHVLVGDGAHTNDAIWGFHGMEWQCWNHFSGASNVR